MNLQSILLKVKHYITISRSIYVLNALLMVFLVWSTGVVGARVAENEFLQVPPRIKKFIGKTDERQDKILHLDSFKSILEQNIFDAEVTPVKKNSSLDSGPGSDPVVKNELEDVLKKLRLTGVLYSRKAGKFCIIKEKRSGKEDIFTVNDEVFETGLLITQIIANLSEPRVYLVMDEKTGILEYEEDDLESLINSKKKKSSGRSKARNKYTKNGKDYNIPKGELENHMRDFSKLLTQAKVVPHKNGYQFRSIKRGSIFEKLGIQRRDIVKKVNGEELKGPKIMELYRLLKHEKEFTVEVERNGRPIALNYNVY